MKAVLEKIKGDRAILVIDGQVLPSDAREGDHLILRVGDDGTIAFEIDHEETEATRQRIEEKMKRLRRGDHLTDENKT